MGYVEQGTSLPLFILHDMVFMAAGACFVALLHTMAQVSNCSITYQLPATVL
jgi:hypothetical protein